MTIKPVSEMIRELRQSDFFLNCRLPMGYSEGLPLLKISNGSLLMVVPFLLYKITGEVDRTLVYPIRYTVTLAMPKGEVVAFENLMYDERFEDMDFSKPVGLFRHESIRDLSKQAYAEERERLLSMYDKVINALLNDGDYFAEDEEAMRALLCKLIEPSLVPQYRALDVDFYEKYLAGGQRL